VAIRADDGEFVQFHRTSFSRGITERFPMMNVGKLLSKFAIRGFEIKAAAWDLAPQDTLILPERGLDLLCA